MEYSYWHTQSKDKPLFADIEWSKPEQRAQAGKLGILGGNKLGFAGVAEAYGVAHGAGVGATRVLLPDILRKTVPPSITDATFAASNPSGSLGKDALLEMSALGSWADGVLLVGDAGRNSETAIVYEQFLESYSGPLTITRDAIDLLKNSSQQLVDRKQTLLVLSFAQLQKLFSSVYYPKILTFSMQLGSLVEALHKFTITYPVAIMVLHKDHLVVAEGGEVSSTAWEEPMLIWRGVTATKAATYWLWTKDAYMAATASLVSEI